MTEITQILYVLLLQVVYKADGLNLDITDLARNKHGLVETHGKVQLNKCEDLAQRQPVSFLIPESFIKVPYWTTAINWSISLQFRTTEFNGLILYGRGEGGKQDYLGLELLEGYLYFIIDTGNGARRFNISSKKFNDGTFHKVSVNQTSNSSGFITVDSQIETYPLGGQLDLNSAVYVGGMDYGAFQNRIPHKFWTGSLRKGYVGCIQDLCINGDQINLVALARRQQVHGVAEFCHPREPECELRPCMHQGSCSEGWNRFICDCSLTNYDGTTCSEGKLHFSL